MVARRASHVLAVDREDLVAGHQLVHGRPGLRHEPDDDRLLRPSDEAEAELLVALERDISRLRHLLGLRGAPLARVLVRGGLVDVAETEEVEDINMMRLVVVL